MKKANQKILLNKTSKIAVLYLSPSESFPFQFVSFVKKDRLGINFTHGAQDDT